MLGRDIGARRRCSALRAGEARRMAASLRSNACGGPICRSFGQGLAPAGPRGCCGGALHGRTVDARDGFARCDARQGYDNALAETINGLYKAELAHRRAPWKTREAVELATLEWVAWFNTQRLLAPIGYIPPADAEANYYRQLTSPVAETA